MTVNKVKTGKKLRKDKMYIFLSLHPELDKKRKYTLAIQLLKKYPTSFYTISKDFELRREKLYALMKGYPVNLDKKNKIKLLTKEQKENIKKEFSIKPVYVLAAEYGISETAVYKILSKNKINRKQEVKKTAYKTINSFIHNLKECGYSEKEIWEKIEEIERKHNMYGKEWYAKV